MATKIAFKGGFAGIGETFALAQNRTLGAAAFDRPRAGNSASARRTGSALPVKQRFSRPSSCAPVSEWSARARFHRAPDRRVYLRFWAPERLRNER